MHGLVQEDTRFTMNVVYSGKKDAQDRWVVRSVHALGLAALDPWFHGRGLCQSVIPIPGDTDSLDVGGVMIMTRKNSWRRWDIFSPYLAELFFGIGMAHWEMLMDTQYYAAAAFSSRPHITASMVRDRLRSLTTETHAPKFTDAARLPETDQERQAS